MSNNSENARVKIPSIITCTRLGYDYISLKNTQYDLETNIFSEVFFKAIKKINKEKDLTDKQTNNLLEDLKIILNNDDLGKEFYEKLLNQTEIKLIDFDNFHNNTFNVVTELTYKKDDDEFRPDITLLINGMPLFFIEVKKPNNKEGIIAERKRMDSRFKNKNFRRFINISQLLVYSNNMNYEDEGEEAINGAFYSTTSKTNAFFNHFREEQEEELRYTMKKEDKAVEETILKDNNLQIIKDNPEFILNKNYDRPTNSLIISLFSKDRIKLFLQYGICYVKKEDSNGIRTLEKHIMRYPQFFASKEIQKSLDKGTKEGIIWHTQGSGKTALAFFNIKWLTNYFSKNKVIAKFYFIVDRIDLLEQASTEFISRGLTVHKVNSREDLIKDMKKTQAINNSNGQLEISIINIQKFSEDSISIKNDYNIEIQRVYFIDEAHRSYKETGNFLPNLKNSDRKAIFISLTGTPLIGKENSKKIWGEYLHKYYYDLSIKDGYTVKLIREDIETTYKEKIKATLKGLETKEGSLNKQEIYSHKHFVLPMLDYIISDLNNTRIRHNDNSLGGMIVCDTSNQAKEFFKIFNENYKQNKENKNTILSSALILHDTDTKKDRKDNIAHFKNKEIDLLIVYGMLLTGFDSPRLKKLYLGRQIKSHNLLQALTRVNRPYKNYKYGYVVDFINIQAEFEKTNKAYWEELGGETNDYKNLFKSPEEIQSEIEEIKKTLLYYTLDNLEKFSDEITSIKDKKILLKIRNSLENSKEIYNLIKLYNHTELLEKLDFKELQKLLTITQARVDHINFQEKLADANDNTMLINEVLEDIHFNFEKIGENELKIADKFRDILEKTRKKLIENIDKKDPKWIALEEEFKRILKKENIESMSQESLTKNQRLIEVIHKKISEINRENNLISGKYNGDKKFGKIHKEIKRDGFLNIDDSNLIILLNSIKTQTDELILSRDDILNNENYFLGEINSFLSKELKKYNYQNINEIVKTINILIFSEYIKEYRGEL